MYELRPYQHEWVSDIRDALRNHRSVLGVLPTGGGKTVCFAYIAARASEKRTYTCICVHRRELLNQTIRALQEMKIHHGVIAPGVRSRRSYIQVASIQTLVRRPQWKFNFLVLDECFPAGTQIDGIPIESISVGDYVSSYNQETNLIEKRRVTHVFRRKPTAIISIKLSNRQVVHCTPNHPFYHKGEWVPACYLRAGDTLTTQQEGPNYENTNVLCMRQELRAETPQRQGDTILLTRLQNDSIQRTSKESRHAVRAVWEGHYPIWAFRIGASPKGSRVLLRNLQSGLPKETKFRDYGAHEQEVCVKKDDREQSDESRRYQKQGIEDIARDWLETDDSRREWALNCTARKTSISIEMGYRDYCSHARLQVEQFEDRCSKSRFNDWDRGRWLKPLQPQSQSSGPKKTDCTRIVRVDYIEVQKSGRDGKFGGVCQDGYVYNIEVEGNSNYFANGVLVHNCHHATAGTWDKVLKNNPNAKVLGVTATPCRLTGKGLGHVFDHIVIGPSISSLTADRYLSPAKVYAPPVDIDPKLFKTLSGDYKRDDVAAAMDRSVITGCAVDHYRRLADRVPAIAFCVSVAHAEHVAEQFTAAGYRASSIDGKMSAEKRDGLIQRLATGRLHVLTSCDLISEGVDVPVVGCGILLRPTKSTGLHLQQVGRCLRTAPGKTHAIILDHAGNTLRHGLPNAERVWTLENGLEKSETAAQYMTCPICYAAHLRATTCPECGYLYPRVPVEKQRMPEQREGQLYEVGHGDQIPLPGSVLTTITERELDEMIAKCSSLAELNRVALQVGKSSGWAYTTWKYRIRKIRSRLKKEAAYASA